MPSPTRLRSVSVAARGFTLLEILVTLAIIGLLAGLAISNSDKIFGQSQETVARVFVRDSLRTALVRYKIDLGDYPSTAEGIAALITAPANKADQWHGPYIETPGGRAPTDPWGEPYRYRYPGTKNKGSYDLYSVGPDKAEGTDDDIGNW
ncbi:MAG TPA: type II secretion system major pseudopilin GspG [Candidatus Didemnitutus sp.]|nr:type II secretion system major pseudopilin GspG [Candidatus Didemnitutus sp.]